MELGVASPGAGLAAVLSAGRQTTNWAPAPHFSPRRSATIPVQQKTRALLCSGSSSLPLEASTSASIRATSVASDYTKTSELVDLDWENLGFGIMQTDYMYIAKSGQDGKFTKGETVPFSMALSASTAALNYSQGLFEGLEAYRQTDGSILYLRPEKNALRMQTDAERKCMSAPSVEQVVNAVKQTVIANERWVPPTGKGSLYIRLLLMGSGAGIGLAPAPEYTFAIIVSPVGNCFKKRLAPVNLIVEDKFHGATPGGTGTVKTVGTNASLLMSQKIARGNGYSGVLYLDAVHKKYLEEVSSCDIFVIKGNVISTPAIKGTILPGITRKNIIDVARTKGFQVEERLVSVDELLHADGVFCTGTAVVVSPVASITYQGKRVEYGHQRVGVITQQLYTSAPPGTPAPVQNQAGRLACGNRERPAQRRATNNVQMRQTEDWMVKPGHLLVLVLVLVIVLLVLASFMLGRGSVQEQTTYGCCYSRCYCQPALCLKEEASNNNCNSRYC